MSIRFHCSRRTYGYWQIKNIQENVQQFIDQAVLCYIDEFDVFNLPSLYNKLTQLFNPTLHFVKRLNYTIGFTLFFRIKIKTKRILTSNCTY